MDCNSGKPFLITPRANFTYRSIREVGNLRQTEFCLINLKECSIILRLLYRYYILYRYNILYRCNTLYPYDILYRYNILRSVFRIDIDIYGKENFCWILSMQLPQSLQKVPFRSVPIGVDVPRSNLFQKFLNRFGS